MTEDEYDAYFDLEEAQDLRHARPKSRNARIVEELVDSTDREAEFKTTYKPSRHEEGWLLSSLRSFYEQQLISDVLTMVKGGKEACVYCCQATPLTGTERLAAKVYRPRQFRNLRNDMMYREGRAILTADGRAAKKTDHRLMRAIGKKSDFGVQAQHTSWLMYEYTTLEQLYQAGAAVPKPVAAAENALLMSYHGDAHVAAPALNDVRLEPEEAAALFQEAIRNIALMLRMGLIHGDLSAYNILYWEGTITVIDFPQVTQSESNRNARFILQRDITRVCEYFARQGVPSDPHAILDDLWTRYGVPESSESDLA